MMRNSVWIVPGLLLFAAIGASNAHADGVTTYNLSATLTDGTTLSGEFTLDVVSNTSATITAFDFTDPAAGISISAPTWSAGVSVFDPAVSPPVDVAAFTFLGPSNSVLNLLFESALYPFDPAALVPPGDSIQTTAFSASGTYLLCIGPDPECTSSAGLRLASVSNAPEPGALILVLTGFGLFGLMMVLRRHSSEGLPGSC